MGSSQNDSAPNNFTFLANLKVIFSYLKSDIIKKQRSFKIGLFTIFLVVFFISLLMNTISIAPVIFLRLSENQAGETDIIMVPFLNRQDVSKRADAFNSLIYGETKQNTKTDSEIKIGDFAIQFLNFTDLHSKLEGEPYIKGLVPRWILLGNTTYTKGTPNVNINSNDQNFTTWAMANLLIINSKLENKYGMGRRLQLEPLQAHECYISDSLYKNLKLDPNFKNDTIALKIGISSILKAMPGFDDLISQIEEEDEEKGKKEQLAMKSILNNNYIYNKQPFSLDLSSNYMENPGKIKNKKNINNNDTDSKKENTNATDNTFNNTNSENNSNQHTSEEKENYTLLKKIMKNKKIRKILENYEVRIPVPKDFNSQINPNNLTNDLPLLLSTLLTSELTKNMPITESIRNIIKVLNPKTNRRLSESAPQPTDYLNYTINLTNLLTSIPETALDSLLTFKLKLKVKAVIDSDSGKWPSVLGNVLAIDSDFASMQLISAFTDKVISIVHLLFNTTIFDPDIQTYIENKLSHFHFDKYTLTVNLLVKDKFTIYKTDHSTQRRTLSTITEKIITKLGFDYPVQMQLPLYESYRSLEIVQIFLENIFQSVMFFLWILSIMLIYSLMLGNVDEKNYEFGMLRALGYKKNNLITMILMQAFLFSLPAITLALVSCYVLNILIGLIVYSQSGLIGNFNLKLDTILWSVVAGLSIPLVSSYFPIKKALSENLKEALTIFNKKIGDISVNIVKLEKLGLSPSALLSSALLIIMGFATYYLAPLSFFLSDYSIFLFIMNSILIVMIVGLIFMLQLLVPTLQSWVLSLMMFLFYPDRNVKFIVLKNLDGHARRNQKTSIMFMIALSFIIFAGCTLRLVAGFIQSASKNIFGGDIWVYHVDNEDTLDQLKLNAYIEEFERQFPHSVKNYTYISYTLRDIIGYKTKLTALCGFPEKDVDLLAVDSALVPSGFSELYMISDYNKKLNYSYYKEIDNNPDIISGLYLNKNKNLEPILARDVEGIIYPEVDIDGDKDWDDPQNNDLLVVVPEGVRMKYSIDINNPGNIVLQQSPPSNYAARIVGLAIKIPGIPSYSSYYTISQFSPALTSTVHMKMIIDKEMDKDPELYKRLVSLPAYYKTPDNIRKQRLIIKFNDGVDIQTKETLFYGIKNFVDNGNTQLIFVDQLIESANKAADIMEYFFLIIGLIALVLSFFLIWTSFYCNIKDNICEYGIMRAIGISKNQAMRVYLYEAAALILSSIIVGTLIGIVISTTLVLQFNLFSELPFKSNFPFILYFIMCLSGFVLGLFGSYYPTSQVNEISLVKVLKGIME